MTEDDRRAKHLVRWSGASSAHQRVSAFAVPEPRPPRRERSLSPRRERKRSRSRSPDSTASKSANDDTEATWRRRAVQRQKDIDRVKNTRMYDRYVKAVPRTKREYGKRYEEHPRTPEAKDRTISKRNWEGQLRKWRGLLDHHWGHPEHDVSSFPSPSSSSSAYESAHPSSRSVSAPPQAPVTPTPAAHRRGGAAGDTGPPAWLPHATDQGRTPEFIDLARRDPSLSQHLARHPELADAFAIASKMTDDDAASNRLDPFE